MAKKNKKRYFIIIVLVLIIIVATIIGIKITKTQSKIQLQEITEKDINYYVLKQDEKFGVIDKNGNVIINPQYAQLKIPNPTKDVFICTDSIELNANWKAVNSSNTSILTEYENIQAISISQITSIVPYEKTVLKYESNNLYGLIDYAGNKITEAIYEEISNLEYKEGYLKIKKEGSYGIIDINGKTIIKPEYDNVMADGYYSDDTKYSEAGFILRIKTDNGYKFGYANKNGKVILDTSYNEINRITEITDDKNTYLIPSSNGKYGLVKNGKQILENEYQEITYDKTNNILIIQKGEAQGICDLNGKNIIPIDYDNITIGGDYINAKKGESRVVFDNKGNEMDTNLTSHNQVTDEYSIIIDENNNYNIEDNSKNKTLTEKYVYIEYYNNDLFIATQGTKTGIINAKGKIVIPLQYSTIQRIIDTKILAATENSTGRVDIIDESGKIQKGLENGKIDKKEKYIKIYSNNDVKYFNIDGSETTYKELFPNNNIYAIKKDGKWGFEDKNGNTIIECKYDMVTEQNGDFAGIELKEKWGMIDKNGNIIIEPTYKTNLNAINFLNKYYAIYTSIIPIYCGDIK